MASRSQGRSPRRIPEGRGPYGVGCGDIMAGLSTSGVFFRLFYPMEKVPGGPPKKARPPWLPGTQYAKGYGAVVGKKLAGVTLKWLLSKVTLPVCWHGKLSDSKNKYPVIIFSHGLGGCRTTYTSICMDIASHGCIVAAVEHRDQSACASFIINNNNSNGTANELDQQWIAYHKAAYEEQELRTRQVNQRKEECIAVLDYLQDLDEGEHLENDLDPDMDLAVFQGRMDLSDVAVCGHSFGGATTIACLSRDDRFKCGVAFDAWMFPLAESHLNVKQPMLFINTEKFQWKANIKRMLSLVPDIHASSGPRRMVTVRGTVHQSQSDFSLIVPQFLAKLASSRGPLDPYMAMACNNDAAIRFLSNYLDLQFIDETDGLVSSNDDLILIGTNVNLKEDEEIEPRKENSERRGSLIRRSLRLKRRKSQPQKETLDRENERQEKTEEQRGD
ncbi:platelet-activating factor acetylhydrolase 2, cytoplasmic-like [Lytechinus variegatus]|uniref:platelet-activating factor acetylhydrolase 2, cytoplasmic-like n=1 Tax=Lytechinus variegatus TaxID=7654 RepID=UPI001BB105DE|nr:platelet-activating factor acetylhydrolase 2, cytoplasmic-like [Lytechinus variegatus]